jgi:hypothetical protein
LSTSKNKTVLIDFSLTITELKTFEMVQIIQIVIWKHNEENIFMPCLFIILLLNFARPLLIFLILLVIFRNDLAKLMTQILLFWHL